MDHKSINASWVTEGKSSTIVARRGRFEPKTLFSIFFKSNVPVLMHTVDEDKAMNDSYYIENYLKPVDKEIRRQRRSSGTKGIKLL